jgi:hypothetical protein
MSEPNANLPWSEQFRVVAKRWVDADAAATLLEDTKSATLSQMIQARGDMPVNRAESLVKASPEWRSHVEKTVDARSAANLLKVQMEYLRMKFSEWQSEEANKRHEARL